MLESNKTLCKSCKVIKLRIEDGKFPDLKNRKWRDESGGLWSGKTCPDCNRNRLKEHMKSKRSKGVSNGEQI